MATDLGKAYVQIVPSAEGISGSIANIIDPEATSAGKKAGINIAGGIGSALKGATTVVAAGATALTGALVKGSSDVAAYGDNIDKMSQKMGLSAQSYQEWDAVMQHSGTSMEAMKSSMKTLANAAETGNKAFEALGISQEQIAGMSQEQLFEATISALQNVENETERTYLAGKTLGRGATELGALLNTSAEDTQAMRDRVRELGGVMSDDAVKSAAAFQDNMQDLQTAVAGVGRNMMSQLLPSMNDIISGFTSLIIGEEGATEKLSKGFSSLFSSLDGIAKNIVSTITQMMPDIIAGITEILPQIIGMASSLLTSIAEAIVGALPQLITTVVPALLEAAINIIVALGNALIQAAPELINAGFQLFEMLKNSLSLTSMADKGRDMIQNILSGITAALPGLLEKGVEILTSLVNGILESLPTLISTAGDIVTQFAGFIMENLPTIVDAGMNLLVNLVDGIVSNLPQIVTAVLEVITKFLTTIVENLPKIIEMGITLIGKLIAGLIQAIPKIVAAIPQIIAAIVKTFSQFDWPSIGMDILLGIKNGILGAVREVIDAAIEAAGAIWDAVKGFFKIGSPSKLMEWSGQMLDEGLALGITKNTGLVDDAINTLGESATAQLQIGNNYGTMAGPQTSDDKLDKLINLLGDYLPQILDAEEKGLTLEGDAQGLFNLVRDQNKIYKRMNGQSAFA